MFDHGAPQFFETDFGLPPERFSGLAGIPLKEVDFGRAKIARIALDKTLPVDPGKTGGEVQKLAHRVTLPRPDDIVIGGALLQHLPHRTAETNRGPPPPAP